MKLRFSSKGFTIVELLIVIVVIAILAAITIVAYNGIQARARDAQRRNDVATITKALELYYIDNGEYPTSSGSTSINAAWSTTADPVSWQNLAAQLVPKYISALPVDPTPTPGVSSLNGGTTNYSYAAPANTTYCGVTRSKQVYILVYTLETGRETYTAGSCTGTQLGYYGASNYRSVK